MSNDNNSDKLKLWVGIVLVLLMIMPFFLKEMRDGKPIKDDEIIGTARFRH
jgi:hypothetical protein